MRRLFIGVNFTDEEKEHFKLIQDIVRKYSERGRYTRPENFHLTLKFLGLMPADVEGKLIEIIDNIHVEELVIQAEHIGFFSKKRGHIVYLGFEPQPELTQFAIDLNDTIGSAGLTEKEEFIYTPHITLCRNAHFVLPLVDISKGINIKKELRITNITLYESINLDGMLTYRPIYSRKVV